MLSYNKFIDNIPNAKPSNDNVAKSRIQMASAVMCHNAARRF